MIIEDRSFNDDRYYDSHNRSSYDPQIYTVAHNNNIELSDSKIRERSIRN